MRGLLARGMFAVALSLPLGLFAGPAPAPDGLLWDAFCGNASLEAVLLRQAGRIPLAFSGHTHRAAASPLGAIRGFNIGGDYHFKRLLLIDWPACRVTAHDFGDSAR